MIYLKYLFFIYFAFLYQYGLNNKYLDGEYGVNGYYVGVPAVLGGKGVEKIIELTLNDEEQALFDNSVNAVKTLIEDMKKLNLL